jgi:hypothetical protein
VSSKVEVHFLDLYNRNPTSSDDRVFVRESLLRFGRLATWMTAESESRFYALAGMAPRFSKLPVRALESYGMWMTATGRFEMPQLQLGGALGGHVYWRAQAGRGNPLWFRDTNVLAGDNGVVDARGAGRSRYEGGFPIFYDAKPSDLDVEAKIEWGVGLGARRVHPDGEKGFDLDAMGWYFRRQLADAVQLPGTRDEGDLAVLKGKGFPAPYEGGDKWELGLNLGARRGRFRLDSQIVRQSIAALVREGFDAELSALFELPGLFLVGETPIGNWIRPVVRVSIIDNKFDVPLEYPWLSVDWDWRKYDLGLRFGVLRDVDLTVEYSRHDMIVPVVGTLHPDEVLVTLRV